MMELEHFFICPYCWQKISMILDISQETQVYIEDCEVCCNPIEIFYQVEEGELAGFDARNIEQ